MSRISMIVMSVLFGFSPIQAGEKTWTGEISDSMCGTSHKAMITGHQKSGEISKDSSGKDADRKCTLACVKDGGKYVFVSKGKVFEISNQDLPALEEHAGHTVKLTGSIGDDGKTIEVSKITMPGVSEKEPSKGESKQY